jgi:hypothetical protein
MTVDSGSDHSGTEPPAEKPSTERVIVRTASPTIAVASTVSQREDGSGDWAPGRRAASESTNMTDITIA